MTVSTTTSRVIGAGNGATTNWPFTFKVLSSSDLEVTYTNASGVETTLSGSAYAVSLNANQSVSPGGSIVYPLVGSPIATGTKLTIRRVMQFTQPTDLKNQGGFYPEVLEIALDRLTLVEQQINELVARSVRGAVSDAAMNTLTADRASKLLGFDASGQPVALAYASAAGVLAPSVFPGANVAGAMLRTKSDLSGFEGRTPAEVTTDITVLRPVTGAQLRSVQDWSARNTAHLTRDFNATGDGSADDLQAIQYAIDQMSARGGRLIVPPLRFRTTNKINGRSHIKIEGEGGCFGYGSLGPVIFGDHNNPIIEFVGDTIAVPHVGNGLGWALEGIGFDGDNRNRAAVNAPEAGTAGSRRGSFNVSVRKCGFLKCRPAIRIENGWDWYIIENGFSECGNVATGTGDQVCAVYLYNGTVTAGGFGTNNIHFKNNFLDVSKGHGVVTDNSGASQIVKYLFMDGNHIGPTGYSAFKGAIEQSSFNGNKCEGSVAGHPIFELMSGGAAGRNQIIGGMLATPGTYPIVVDDVLTEIAWVTFVREGSGGAYIRLGANSQRCIVGPQITNDTAGFNGVPLVSDAGANNSILPGINGSDVQPANNVWPIKLLGTAYKLPVLSGTWPTFSPTVTSFSGTIGSTTVVARTLKVFHLVFFALDITITGVGTGSGGLNVAGMTAAKQGSSFGGNESVNGYAITGQIDAAGTTMFLRHYDGASSLVSLNHRFKIAGCYEANVP